MMYASLQRHSLPVLVNPSVQKSRVLAWMKAERPGIKPTVTMCATFFVIVFFTETVKPK
jgi:hypothetical protein